MKPYHITLLWLAQFLSKFLPLLQTQARTLNYVIYFLKGKLKIIMEDTDIVNYLISSLYVALIIY